MFSTLDCGLVKITDPEDLPFAEMGWSSDLQPNQPCISLGHCHGFNRQRGPVVRFGRIVKPVSKVNGYIQSTCLMEPGDSGGPLFDVRGRVIGIHTQIEDSLDAENVEVEITRDGEKKLLNLDFTSLEEKNPTGFTDDHSDAGNLVQPMPELESLADQFDELEDRLDDHCTTVISQDGDKRNRATGTFLRFGDRNFIVCRKSLIGERPGIELADDRFIDVDTVDVDTVAEDERNDLILLGVPEEIDEQKNTEQQATGKPDIVPDNAANGVVPQIDPAKSLEAMALTTRALRNAVTQIEPSLVTIESFGGVSAVQGRIGGIRTQGEGNTTGVVISEDGLIVTSTFNFIQRPPIITVVTHDGERHFADLLGRDDTRKICLLKIRDVNNMPVPEFGSVADLKVGQWAVSAGVGYGDTEPAVSIGIISATNRIGGRAIQTDANISPANYGGPLLDIEGRLLGICVPMNPQSQAVGAGVEWYDSGIGFAVPLEGLEDRLAKLVEGENVAPAFLGIRAVPNNSGDGLLIEEVIETSAAEEAGLERGDRITGLNGEKIGDIMKLKTLLNRFESGQEIDLTYIPDGETREKTASITLGIAPRPVETSPLEPPTIR